ncbi:MAG: ABC transporter substrate-binding protein [Desulfovibrionaceae bacterium]
MVGDGIRRCALALAALLVLASGAGAEGPWRLGVIAARSGDAASSNEAVFRAVRYAVDEINAAGGLLGRSVETVEIDNQSSALGSKAAAEQAVSLNTDAVIGAIWSGHSLAMAPVLQAAGIPMISPMSTNPAVTRAGNYIFRVCYTDAAQGAVMARYARQDLGAARAAILTNVSRVYSVDLGRVFDERFRALGGDVLWRGAYTIDTADYLGLLQMVRAVDPDVLYVPGDYRDSSCIIKQARGLGLRAVILGGDAFGLRLYDYIGDAADGCYYTTHWHPDSPLAASRRFTAAWEARFGPIRQTTIPMTYDAVMLWADAVRRAGGADRARVRDALAATRDFHGVTGRIRFEDGGDPRRPIIVNRLEGGRAVFVRAVEP